MTNTKSIPFKRNLLLFGAIAASVGYIFSIGTGSIGMMVFVLAWIVNFKSLDFSNFKQNKNLFLLMGFYALIIICAIYSINPHQAQKEVTRFLAFAVFPLIFSSIHPFNQEERRKFIKAFIGCLILFFIICLTHALYRQFVFFNQGGHFNWYFFYRYDFVEIFRQHPTYVSMYTNLALCFIAFEKEKQFLFKNGLLRFTIVMTLILALVLYGSRIGYIIFGIFVLIYLLKLLKRKQTKEIAFVILFFIGIGVLGWNIPIVKERILFTLGKKIDYKFNNSDAVEQGTPEEQGRLLLWQDALDLIKIKPLWGYGTGSSKQILTEKYEKEGHGVFLQERYNAHNTYLELMIWGGIILLIAYLILIGNILRNFFIRKEWMILSFFIIIMLTGITETIFLAQGIMFFAFFYSFFLNKKSNG